MLQNIRSLSRARTRGNDLFKSERFTEACSAYGEGLRFDPSNPILYCNRAACWFKLGLFERSLDDCNQALLIHPNYTKALLRRAATYSKVYIVILVFTLYNKDSEIGSKEGEHSKSFMLPDIPFLQQYNLNFPFC